MDLVQVRGARGREMQRSLSHLTDLWNASQMRALLKIAIRATHSQKACCGLVASTNPYWDAERRA